MIKFGVCLPTFAGGSAYTNSIDYEELERYALRAEEQGFESLWIADHLVLGHEGGEHEVWTTLSALAQKTSRIRLGTLVLCNTHRNPAFLAKMAATLDYLTGGRLDLGIGAGWYRGEHDQYGIYWAEAVKERMDRLEESVVLIKKLLSQPAVTHSGDFYGTVNAVCQPVTLQQPWPRILVGGGGEKRTLKIVAEHADTWNIPAITPDEYAHKLQVLRKHCDAVGRDYSEIEKTIETRILIAEDDASTDRLVDWYLYWQRTAEQDMDDRDEVASKLREIYVIGSPDECVEKLQSYVDAGVQHFTMYFLDYPFSDTMDRFTREVRPRIKELATA
jgi:F420-dependent oxidoreductase-like protein